MRFCDHVLQVGTSFQAFEVKDEQILGSFWEHTAWDTGCHPTVCHTRATYMGVYLEHFRCRVSHGLAHGLRNDRVSQVSSYTGEHTGVWSSHMVWALSHGLNTWPCDPVVKIFNFSLNFLFCFELISNCS